MHRPVVLVVLAMVAGCGKGKTEDDCAVAIGHVQALMEAKLPAGLKPDVVASVKSQMAAANTAMTTRCHEDKWPSAAVSCIKDLKQGDDPATCEKLLTQKQRDAADKAADAALSSAKAPGQLEAAATIAGIKEYRQKMCACTDYACAENVERDYAKFERSTEHARKDPNVRQEFTAIDDEAMRCFDQLLKQKKN